jgi:hypothetical protein
MVDCKDKPVSIFKEEDLIDKDEYTKLSDLRKPRQLITGQK